MGGRRRGGGVAVRAIAPFWNFKPADIKMVFCETFRRKKMLNVLFEGVLRFQIRFNSIPTIVRTGVMADLINKK